MVASPKGLGSDKNCTGEDQQHIQNTDLSSHQRRFPTKKQDRNCQTVINISVSRNVTLALTLTREFTVEFVSRLLQEEFFDKGPRHLTEDSGASNYNSEEETSADVISDHNCTH
jgi:hypothetical protein